MAWKAYLAWAAARITVDDAMTAGDLYRCVERAAIAYVGEGSISIWAIRIIVVRGSWC
jgi:hypothetical protein